MELCKMRNVSRRRRRFNLYDRPYLVWTLKDGTQVLADRGYNGIAERRGLRSIGHIIDRWRWVEDIAEERWLKTPRFTTGDLAPAKRWSNDALRRFLDGRDMDLQPYPIKRRLPTGEVDYIDRDGVVRVSGVHMGRSAPRDWPPAWPAGLRLRSEPELPVLPARIIPFSPFPTPPNVTLL
jgi:hypothetical protein